MTCWEILEGHTRGVFSILGSRTLNALGVSSIYAILPVIPLVLKNFNLEQDVSVFTLLHILSELARLTFQWPSKKPSGLYAMNYVHIQRKEKNYFGLIDFAVRYIHEASQLCAECLFAKHLNKPKSHRFLELYRHPISFLVHALFISSSNVEANHTGFKGSFHKSDPI